MVVIALQQSSHFRPATLKHMLAISYSSEAQHFRLSILTLTAVATDCCKAGWIWLIWFVLGFFPSFSCRVEDPLRFLHYIIVGFCMRKEKNSTIPRQPSLPPAIRFIPASEAEVERNYYGTINMYNRIHGNAISYEVWVFRTCLCASFMRCHKEWANSGRCPLAWLVVSARFGEGIRRNR